MRGRVLDLLPRLRPAAADLDFMVMGDEIEIRRGWRDGRTFWYAWSRSATYACPHRHYVYPQAVRCGRRLLRFLTDRRLERGQ